MISGILRLYDSDNIGDQASIKKKKCLGYNNAVFSGVTTQTLANIIEKIIIPKKVFSGLYHISAKPINKYKLLCMIAKTYNKKIKILRFKNFRINRSLNSNFFKKKKQAILLLAGNL